MNGTIAGGSTILCTRELHILYTRELHVLYTRDLHIHPYAESLNLRLSDSDANRAFGRNLYNSCYTGVLVFISLLGNGFCVYLLDICSDRHHGRTDGS